MAILTVTYDFDAIRALIRYGAYYTIFTYVFDCMLFVELGPFLLRIDECVECVDPIVLHTFAFDRSPFCAEYVGGIYFSIISSITRWSHSQIGQTAQ